MAMDRGNQQESSSSWFGGDRGEEMGRSVEADLRALREDLNNLTENVAKLVSKTKKDAAKSVREMTSNMADRAGNMAGDLAEKSSNAASAATNQVKSLGAELQGMAHRNPLGTLAGAVLVGVLIGMFGRRS
jgi:ElaB/YqjD/DUF883 family membrane-anchored ribosome-binding protein